MSTDQRVAELESLAAIAPGQDIEIVRVLLPPAGAGGGDPSHHLRPGRRWRCRYSGSINLLLVNASGQTVIVPRDVARYVQVRRAEDPEPR